MITLSPRLECVAHNVREGSSVVDVGTDHAYIPAYLLLNGKITGATACDIGRMPLENAAKTLEKYGLSDRIKLVLSDGLACILPEDGTDIVIAGMGGELIVRILSEASWLKDGRYRLILQPMTHSEDVRKFLSENGFCTETEASVSEGKKTYIVICAYYDGAERTTDAFSVYFGKLDDSRPSADYRKRQYIRICNKRDGAKLTGDGEAYSEFSELARLYEEKYGV